MDHPTWEAGPGLSGLFAYPLAAFARRIAERPDAFCPQYQNDAIEFTNAVIESYAAFRDVDMYLVDGDPFAYYKHPRAYASLVCDIADADEKDDCEKQRMAANTPMPWNLSMSFLKAMAEVAVAADSTLYRSSSQATANGINYGTKEAPRLIAKNVNFFVDDLTRENLSDVHHGRAAEPARVPKRRAVAQDAQDDCAP